MCDGQVHFPLPDDVPRFDPRIQMQVLWITVQMALTDIETIDQGPTQYVPGSHYSGRGPNDQDHPEFDGRGPTSVFCKAGDILFSRPAVLAPGCAQPIGSDTLYFTIAVRRTMGILAF